MSRKYLTPEWPAPSNVNAFSSTRIGGVGDGPFDTFNMGLHVGDNPMAVKENRELLKQDLALPCDPVWLEQIHGTDVKYIEQNYEQPPAVDAAWTDIRGCVLTVMSADCLPVLFASRCGNYVGVAHAGWRGLAGGVLANLVSQLPVDPIDIVAWLGPAIGPARFEVGVEVMDAFERVCPKNRGCFTESPFNTGKYLADIYALASRALQSVGVRNYYCSNHCTFNDSGSFFSHRRDKGQTGRMVSLIWMT